MDRVLTTRAFQPERSIVAIGSPPADGARAASRVGIGSAELAIIAGPRAVGGPASLRAVAHDLRAAGASIVRAGTWRPLRSAHALHGLALDALESLATAGAATGTPVATDVMDPRDVARVARSVDLLIVGEAAMQNRPLLAEVGRSGRPVVLERGTSATLDELLDAAEHVMAHGNAGVVLCERGIRTAEPRIAAALDLSAIPLLKSLTHLPVIVAPGEACVREDLIAPLACAAVAAGADGLMLDVDDGASAERSGDAAGRGSLNPAGFARLIERVRPFAIVAGRTLPTTVGSNDRNAGGLGASAASEHDGPRGVPHALRTLRADIEQVDRRIVELIAERVDLARAAGRVKRDVGLPVIDEAQEHDVLARVRELAASAGLPYEELHALQAYLIEISRRAQTRPPPTTM